MDLKHIQRSDHCLNCSRPLDPEKDNFCPACGQLNNVKKETAMGLVRELAGDFLHLDSKVTRNLGPLLFKPGKLTVDYLAGKRARYFHPVRLFLTVTVIMFIVRGFTNHYEPDPHVLTKSDTSNVDFSFNTGDGIKISAGERDTSDNGIEWNMGDKNIPGDTMRKYILDYNITDSEVLADTLGISKTIWSKLLLGQVIKTYKQGFEKLSDYFRHKLPWMVFALMPVFAFVLWLVYFRRKYYFSDHLVFAFHLHTATFVIYIFIKLVGLLVLNTGYMLLLYPIYYFVSLKNVYKQSWLKTILKGIVAGFLYCFLGIISMILLSLLLILLF